MFVDIMSVDGYPPHRFPLPLVKLKCFILENKSVLIEYKKNTSKCNKEGIIDITHNDHP